MILSKPRILLSRPPLSLQSFDICGRVGGVRKALKLLCSSQVSWLRRLPAEFPGTRSRGVSKGVAPARVHSCVSLSPLSSRITASAPPGSSAQKLARSVPSARLSSGSL